MWKGHAGIFGGGLTNFSNVSNFAGAGGVFLEENYILVSQDILNHQYQIREVWKYY